jgi:DNA modification methylase
MKNQKKQHTNSPRQHDGGAQDKELKHLLQIEEIPVAALKPYARNARRHSKTQVKQIVASFKEFGIINPIIVDEANNILAGHGRLEAAKTAGIAIVPIVRVTGLTEGQKRAYRIADNRIAENAGWDHSILAQEFKDLSSSAFEIDVTVTGFEMGAIDVIIGEHAPADIKDEADHQPAVDPERPIISKPGDLWQLGAHRLLCACSLDIESYARLLDGKGADMVFTDPPFNIVIDRFVCGLGGISHEEFAMASGEMSPEEFRAFLLRITANLVEATRDGSIHFICMDWRHIRDLLDVGSVNYSELKAICVWNKTNGGMGSLYRSKHEFVAVFKNGEAPHINNVALGKHGRNRTTVWDYAGVNSFGGERDNLAIHPTVKPVKLVEDAILDCSNRGDRVLDAFCGSGTTIIAAERAGRRGFGLEIEPKYVDATLRRFRTLTGEEPVRLSDGALLKSLE